MAFDGTILLRASVAGTAFWYLIFSTIVFSVMHIRLSIFPHLHKHGSCPHTQ